MKRGLTCLVSAVAMAIGVSSPVAEETVYFLVGGFSRIINDSYVLPLSRAEDISHARYLVSRYGLGNLDGDRPLVVAKVAAAKDDINRNFLDPKFPKWSWQVAEFLKFNDYTVEELDGGPKHLEEDFDWSSGGGMTIGFWHYTVVRELGPAPLYLSIIPEGQNLEFYWSSLGTNHVYTLEGKESLASTNWFALPGAAWPLKTNHWALSQANVPARLYRVRAEQTSGTGILGRELSPRRFILSPSPKAN